MHITEATQSSTLGCGGKCCLLWVFTSTSEQIAAGKAQICPWHPQRLACVQGEDGKGIQLKREHCRTNAFSFKSFYRSVSYHKKSCPCFFFLPQTRIRTLILLFPHSQHCALPDSGPEPDSPTGLYPFHGLSTSRQEPGAVPPHQVAKALLCQLHKAQQLMDHKEQAASTLLSNSWAFSVGFACPWVTQLHFCCLSTWLNHCSTQQAVLLPQKDAASRPVKKAETGLHPRRKSVQHHTTMHNGYETLFFNVSFTKQKHSTCSSQRNQPITSFPKICYSALKICILEQN